MKILLTSRKLIVFAWILLLVGITPVSAEAEEPLVSIMLFDTDIRDALSEISLQTGITIVPDQTVSGTVTADIQELSLEEALRIVLAGGGFTFHKVDGFYLVGLPDPRSSTFGELVETRIIALQHINFDQLNALLPIHLQSYVKGDRQTSLISISAPPRQLQTIIDLVGQIDYPQKQVEVKVVITEISSQAVKEIGNSIFEFEGSGGQEVNWDWTGAVSYEENFLTINSDIYGSLMAKLRMLETEQKAKVHADPRILLADGQSAELFTGDRQILLLTPEGENTTSRIERIEVGLSLNLTADVIGNEDVVLRVDPEISYFIPEARPDLMIKRNSLSTTVRLKSGQTAALAGLTLQDTSLYTKKAPVLGSIPLIRWLFRNDVDRESNKELLVFVTPVIQEGP